MGEKDTFRPGWQGKAPPERRGQYYVLRDGLEIRGFVSFYEAYLYALNKFGSENFLVQKEGW